jgi:hypothetical protein
MLVMLSESGGGSNLLGEGLGEERASRSDEVALQFKRLGEERASRSNNTKIQKMKMLGAN